MTVRPHQQQDHGALEREAIAWLVRVTDEGATAADRAALQRWQAESPDRARALAKAGELWHAMPAAIALAVRSGAVSLPVEVDRPTRGRRGILIGLAASAAAAVGVAVVRPPLGLWPSFTELTADYRTTIGQRRRIAISEAVSVEMNTRTSIALRRSDKTSDGFELISGEAVVEAAAGGRQALVSAGGGTATTAGRVDVRCEDGDTAVTCLAGTVEVRYRDRAITLGERQRVGWGATGVSPVAGVDPEIVTSWRQGYLMFRRERLAAVIAEVNRYRPGRIFLVDARLASGEVTARFRLDRLDDVVVQIREVFGAPVTTLPGGVVLVG